MTAADLPCPPPGPPDPTALGWFCLWAQPKHEHIAAAHLRQSGIADVFLPRIRFQRATRQGKAWVTEALFPNYLFARFHWQTELRRAQHARGVRGVVHFGDRWPTIPDDVIADLRAAVGAEELRVIPGDLVPGDEVQIVSGSFQGLSAVVMRVMTGRERVTVLMEFLGRQTSIELPAGVVIKPGEGRMNIG